MFRGVPGFLEGVSGCSGFSRRCSGVFRVFHTVPGVPGCPGVPCSGVPGITTSCPFFPLFLERKGMLRLEINKNEVERARLVLLCGKNSSLCFCILQNSTSLSPIC